MEAVTATMTRNVMLTEDYMVRQLSILITALMRIVGLRTAYKFVEAQMAIDEALQDVFGIPASLVRQMDDQALHQALTVLDVLNLDKLQMAAEIFKEEGDVLIERNKPADAVQAYTRALNFFLDVVLNGGAWHLDPPHTQINTLVSKLAGEPLDPDTWFGIFLYASQQKQWHQAETALDKLTAYPDLVEEVQRMGAEFYTRLATESEQSLQAGGTTRVAVEAGLKRWVN
jgi:hypothetical protein